MSRNSKTKRKLARKKQFKMTKGPARTVPVHGKTKAWYQRGKSNNPTAKRKRKDAHVDEAANDSEAQLAA